MGGYPKAVIEALADWWLLGETDLAVIGPWSFTQSTFARTAFARGARARSLYLVGREGFVDGRPIALMRPTELIQCDEETEHWPMGGTWHPLYPPPGPEPR